MAYLVESFWKIHNENVCLFTWLHIADDIINKFYELSFDLQPDDQIIPPGQQIGLMIFSSDKEFTLHPDPGTELTVDLDGTSITLPVVGGKAALETAME